MKVATTITFNLGNKYKIAKFNDDKLNNIGYFRHIIPKAKYFNFFKNSIQFHKYVEKQIWLHQHPFVYKVLYRDDAIVRFKFVNLTHSSKDIKVNNEWVKKIHVGYYMKEGKKIDVYITDCNYIVEMPIN